MADGRRGESVADGASSDAVADPDRGARIDLRALGVAALQLTALSSFAIAQPLFDLLGDNATFFAFRQSTPLEIVAFALLVTLAPAALLVVVQALAALIDPRAGTIVHLLSIAGLVSMIALQVAKGTELERTSVLGLAPASVLALTALLAGGAAAVVYARSRAVQSLVTVLGAAPLLFVGLFLLGSPVKKLVFVPDEARVPAANVSTAPPIVMVVFDEFAVSSLMDGEGRIDPVRYPSFARLARESTWYRNTAAVSPWTEQAVPAMLTGNYPRSGALPAQQDHPRNLFTLFAGSHDFRVYEPLTSLCPARLCHRTAASGIAPGMRPLLTDASIVYLHTLLPASVVARAGLPNVTTTWGDFRANAGDRPPPSAAFDLFLDSLDPTARPGLYFLHVELPHSPWRYFPSGRQYLGRTERTPGVVDGRWLRDDWVMLQGQQRYLLQVGFVDRLLGRLLARLRANGLYERALVVMAADHGVGFSPGDTPRGVTAANVADVALVPFFVKAPRQTSGRIVDRPLATIDILPTLAGTLGVRLPWTIDGRSALSGTSRPTLRLEGQVFAVRSLAARRSATVAARVAALGAREGWGRVLRIGPHTDLLGRAVSDLHQRPAAGVRARIEDEEAYAVVDPRSSFVPAYVSGAIEGEGAAPRRPLAVAVNGRIAGVTRTYADGGRVRFAAVVSETAFRSGSNEVGVYAVSQRAGRVTVEVLARTGGAATFSLREDADGELLVSGEGDRIGVREEAVRGHVEAELERDRVTFRGWAADLVSRRPRDRVVLFADGRFVASFSETVERRDLGADLSDAGFSFVLPLSALTRRSADPEVRVFALVGRVASELTYPDGYRWR